MKTALFITLPSPSHYHATFGLAKELEENGYEIIYTGTQEVKGTIEKQGYQYHPFYYLTEYFITSFKTFLLVFIKSKLDKSFFIRRYREFLEGVQRIQILIRETSPTHIFIDEHLVEYALFLQQNHIHITIVCTKLSSKKARGIPPMNSYYKPDGSVVSNLVCEFLWYKNWAVKWYKKMILKIAFGGTDESYFFKHYGKKINLDTSQWFDDKNYHFRGVRYLPRIILGTRKLEFPWRPSFENESYLLRTTVRNEQEYMTDAYQALIATFELRRQIENIKLIYCSFGTVIYKDIARMTLFMQKLLAGKLANPHTVLIISKGNLPLTLSKLTDVHFFDFLPQLDLLNRCDLMITHGGHNSIKECLQFDVPMLVYPHMEDNDQPGNAVRVELNGFGIMGNLQKDSTAQIWHKITSLLTKGRNIKRPSAHFEST